MDVQVLRFVPAHLRGLFCQSPVTFWRWCAGRSRPPRAALILAQILVNGDLVQGGTACEGWTINRRTGGLVDPQTGLEHTPAQIRAWHWTAQELQGLRSEENQRGNVLRLHTGRDGHAVTLELHRRLIDKPRTDTTTERLSSSTTPATDGRSR